MELVQDRQDHARIRELDGLFKPAQPTRQHGCLRALAREGDFAFFHLRADLAIAELGVGAMRTLAVAKLVDDFLKPASESADLVARVLIRESDGELAILDAGQSRGKLRQTRPYNSPAGDERKRHREEH